MEGTRFDSLTGQWAAQGLRLYLHLRLLAKPELPIETIRQEYFDAFGPAAVYDGSETVPEGRQAEARQALDELVAFRKQHESTFFSDQLHVTSYLERRKLDVDTLAVAEPAD